MLVQTPTNMYQKIIMLFNKSSFRKPTAPIYALSDNLIRNTNLLSPLHRSFGSTERDNKSIVGFVSCLLLQCSPPTIATLVISPRVSSIYLGVFLPKLLHMRPVTFIHVLFKFLKGLPQAFYSMTAIAIKTTIFWIFTPTSHIKPDCVKPVFSMPYFLSMLVTRTIDANPEFVRTCSASRITSPTYRTITITTFFHNLLPKKDTRFASRYP